MILVTYLLTTENFPLENGFEDQKLLIPTHKDPKIHGYLKEINLCGLQEQTKKTYKKEIPWILQTYVQKKDNLNTLLKKLMVDMYCLKTMQKGK